MSCDPYVNILYSTLDGVCLVEKVFKFMMMIINTVKIFDTIYDMILCVELFFPHLFLPKIIQPFFTHERISIIILYIHTDIQFSHVEPRFFMRKYFTFFSSLSSWVTMMIMIMMMLNVVLFHQSSDSNWRVSQSCFRICVHHGKNLLHLSILERKWNFNIHHDTHNWSDRQIFSQFKYDNQNMHWFFLSLWSTCVSWIEHWTLLQVEVEEEILPTSIATIRLPCKICKAYWNLMWINLFHSLKSKCRKKEKKDMKWWWKELGNI